ncbi:tryptophan--tRNA ligase [Candidatus Aminicenantes bacterium AC-335-A11]|jgi:tryptophanyl-tRNA synthetase|nr:tryptophan--tRNA ligase [SCandidatus Aminicenantes bacterium Aminicenantia_JdfR_composite]MCP2618427.1 tryptophan--tRNA ligase [Candidatus Aminicenantes bacterium AC-335-A11]MCP2620734.1 tryptophan--tRNA ligase [Candidatus Aminicenantes bacterium AC-334-E05]
MKKIVLSGMRPTGALHLGHIAGALRNWIKLQDKYECYYSIVSWHALSSEYKNSKVIKNYIFELAVDWLSAGLDPEKSVIFLQSEVKEHAELHLLLSMIIPLPWLERVPTFKEMQKQLPDKELNTYGFLGYPVLQTADIIIYKANYVPVGEDQVYHIELAREIVRRFNRFFGKVFPEPEVLLTEVPRLAGTDGRKMSKSYNNAIYIGDPPSVIEEKIKPMVTDTRRKRRSDPGEPNDCPVFTLHKAFTPEEKINELAQACRKASIGCLDCKKVIIDELIEEFAPLREKRNELLKNPKIVWDILEEGNKKARKKAQQTMEEVRKAIGF